MTTVKPMPVAKIRRMMLAPVTAEAIQAQKVAERRYLAPGATVHMGKILLKLREDTAQAVERAVRDAA